MYFIPTIYMGSKFAANAIRTLINKQLGPLKKEDLFELIRLVALVRRFALLVLNPKPLLISTLSSFVG